MNIQRATGVLALLVFATQAVTLWAELEPER
jgi:hypothetical protein